MSSSSDRTLADRKLPDRTARRSSVLAGLPELGLPSLPELLHLGESSPVDLQRVRDDARTEGYSDGYTAGQAAAEGEAVTRLNRLRQLGDELAVAIAEIRGRQDEVVDSLADELTTVALAVAESLVGRELLAVPAAAISLARARAVLGDRADAEIHVHPDDLDVIASCLGAAHAVSTVIADPSIEPGGCVLVVAETRVDGSLDAAVRRVRDALLGEVDAVIVSEMRLDDARRAARAELAGHVTRIVGVHLEVVGVPAAVGDALQIETNLGPLGAEVVAVDGDRLVCMPFGDLYGLRAGAAAVATGGPPTIAVGASLLGRVLDGLGRPLDGRPLGSDTERVTVSGSSPHPLRRAVVDTPLALGVRALDTLVPCGRGQRLGIFAGSGVGKSSLLSMVARGTEADVSVVALVGERGREVREFIERDLGPEGLARSVVVVATSDEPALVRLRAATTATRIAEWFRDAGRHVVLMMDSVTRVAMAQREVGLSAGEPPATRGYPPSVFSLLPRLLERAGAGEVGSITGLYTVLVEGDDMDEPIADTARSILDGHVVLSRKLATTGHFPTIDVLESISRVTPSITTPAQRMAATEIRRLMAARRDVQDLLDIGAYVPGTDATVDRAVALTDDINTFLRQSMDERAPVEESWRALEWLASAG